MNVLIKSILTLASVGLSLPAMAGLISHTFDGNDCAGYFGDSFDACQIFVNEDGEKIEISPVIAKYEFNDDFDLVDTEINDLFSSFDGSEVTVEEAGTWSYTPGENDPGIRYWSAKGGDYFNLFWYVNDADEAACAGYTYTLTCLNLAQSVTDGDWSAPINDKNGRPYGLSHLVVYDTESPTTEPPTIVPEPGTAALLLTGIMGLVLARRLRTPA